MKVILAEGIESMSGSVKSKNGYRLVCKTFKRPSANRVIARYFAGAIQS